MVTVYAITNNKVEEITFEKETAEFYVNQICNGRKYIIRVNKSRSGYYKTAEDAIQARISYLESKIEDANKEIVMLTDIKNASSVFGIRPDEIDEALAELQKLTQEKSCKG